MSTVDPAEVLATFDRLGPPGAPLTAPEVADAVGCARRTAYEKLSALAERGDLATKKVGARGRVWWRPPSDRTPAGMDSPRAGGTDRPAGDGRERALRELHDATRRLMHAESRETVCEIAVDAARRIVGLSLCGLWLHTSEDGMLEPVAWTESGVEEYGEPPAFPVEGSLVGRVFREGEHRVYDDVTAEEDLYDPETRVRSELVLPLGEYGVLNASSTEVGAFDAADVSLGRVLATNVRTALQRVDQLAERRARRRELERQRDELATLNRINALVEDTIDALVGAATREEIETTVCERLAASDFYLDAWIGERDPSSGRVVVRTGAGDEGAPVASLLDGDEGLPAPNPVATAVEENAIQVIQRLRDDERVPDRLRAAALSNDARACLVVPLAYADTVFGALVVHGPTPEGFSDRELAAFGTLGRVVGFVVNATNNRQLLLGNTAVELEVAIGEGESWVPLAASERVDAAVGVEGLVPTGDGAVIEYVTVEDPSSAADPADLLDVPGVVDLRVVGADDARWFLECTVRRDDANLRVLTEYGSTVRRARASDGGGTVVARFPAATTPREAMGAVEDAFPTAELVAKRVVDLSDRSMTRIGRRISDRLTDKQLTALRAAFLAGYYDDPRGTTAQELAASLGVAPSTLYQHLQAAQRKVLATVLDE